jgi:hypothetical protein
MKANHVTRDKGKEADYSAISKSRRQLRRSSDWKSASKGERERMEAEDKAAVLRNRYVFR